MHFYLDPFLDDGDFFENETTCSKRMRKTLVATQLKREHIVILRSVFYKEKLKTQPILGK